MKKESFIWGLMHVETGGIYSRTFAFRKAARDFKKEYKFVEFKVIKLVPEDAFVPVTKKMPEEKIDIKNLATITEDHNGNVLVDGKYGEIERRDYEELTGKAIWLYAGYTWKIVRDSDGELCLVASKKESI